MSATIQWCDGPRPSVKRPSHTAWFASACCAIAIGCRVWIGITAVASSTRDVARPISVMAVSASKSFGTCGTQIDVKPAVLGRFGVGDEPRDLVAVPALLRADHEADPHVASLSPGRRRHDPNEAEPDGNGILVFRESACAHSGMRNTRPTRTPRRTA